MPLIRLPLSSPTTCIPARKASVTLIRHPNNNSSINRRILKNIFRHPLRTWLTAVGIVVAIIAFGVLRTVVDTLYAGAEAISATRLVTRNAISLAFTLPISYRNKIRQVAGVDAITHADWFGGVYISEKNFFPQFAIDPKSYLDLYSEYLLSPGEKSAFLHDRQGAIAGRKLAQQYGWKIGDVIPLRGTIYPGNWSLVLRGIYRGAEKKTDETNLFFHWDYLNETLKKTASDGAEHVRNRTEITITRPIVMPAWIAGIQSAWMRGVCYVLVAWIPAFPAGMTDL